MLEFADYWRYRISGGPVDFDKLIKALEARYERQQKALQDTHGLLQAARDLKAAAAAAKK